MSCENRIISAIKNSIESVHPKAPEEIFTQCLMNRLGMEGFRSHHHGFKTRSEIVGFSTSDKYELKDSKAVSKFNNNWLNPDVIIKDENGRANFMIEIKKIKQDGNIEGRGRTRTFKYFYTGDEKELVDPENKWPLLNQGYQKPIFLHDSKKLLTFFNEGQLWNDAIRLLSFGNSTNNDEQSYNKYILCFIDNTNDIKINIDQATNRINTIYEVFNNNIGESKKILHSKYDFLKKKHIISSFDFMKKISISNMTPLLSDGNNMLAILYQINTFFEDSI